MSARAESRSEYETGAERGRRAYRLDETRESLFSSSVSVWYSQ